MSSLIRYSLRRLSHAWGFSSTAILTIALGVGFCVCSFSTVNSLLLRDVPYPQADRLVRIFRTTPQTPYLAHSVANFADFRAAATSFSEIAAYNTPSGTFEDRDRSPESVSVIGATVNFFEVLEIRPVIGHGFAAEGISPSAPGQVVLTYRGWQRLYNGDASVVGRTVRLDGVPSIIVGILPPEFDAPLVWGAADMVSVFGFVPQSTGRRVGGFIQAVGRLKPGVSLNQAQSELSTVMAQLDQQYPRENNGLGLYACPLHDSNVSGSYRTLTVLMVGLSLLMLLITCANIAGLQVTRALRDNREFAVRAALGGSRWQLMSPLIVENLILAFVGGGLGLLLAWWGNAIVAQRMSALGGLPLHNPIDGRVYLFAAVTTLGCGLAFGLAPALFASRSSSSDALKDASRAATASRGQQHLKRILLGAQLALALALVGVASSLGVGVKDFTRRALGWQPAEVLTASLSLPYSRYPRQLPERNIAFQRALLERVSALPGVKSAALAGALPFSSLDVMSRTNGFLAEGLAPAEPGHETQVDVDLVSSDFFSTLQIPLWQGAVFAPNLTPGNPPVGIVNRALAERFWPGENPIGRRFQFSSGNSVPGMGGTYTDGGQWIQIVGVVDNIRMASRLESPLTPLQVYLPLSQRTAVILSLAVRTTVLPESLADAVSQAVSAVDPQLPLVHSVAARTLIDQNLNGVLMVVEHLGASAFMGLVIAGIGLFGVIAQMTALRTREIGIRIALGASRLDVARLVLSEAGFSLGFGVAAGLLVLFPLLRIVRHAAPEIELPGTWLWAANIGLLVVIGLLACWLPTRRATRIDPIIALRED